MNLVASVATLSKNVPLINVELPIQLKISSGVNVAILLTLQRRAHDSKDVTYTDIPLLLSALLSSKMNVTLFGSKL